MLRAWWRLARMLPASADAPAHRLACSATADAVRSENAALRRALKARLGLLTEGAMAHESACTCERLPRAATNLPALVALSTAAAGQRITERVLASAFFQQVERIGVYVHCARLREVDTRPLLTALLAEGAYRHCIVHHAALAEPDAAPCRCVGCRARCYVPLVEDRQSNMRLLHLGAAHRTCLAWPRCQTQVARLLLGLPAQGCSNKLAWCWQTRRAACARCRRLTSWNPRQHMQTARLAKTVRGPPAASLTCSSRRCSTLERDAWVDTC